MWVKETYRTCASLRAACIPARLLAEFWTPVTMCLHQISGERETTGIVCLCESVCAWAWLCFKLWPRERKSNRKEACALGRDGAMCMCVRVTVCLCAVVCVRLYEHTRVRAGGRAGEGEPTGRTVPLRYRPWDEATSPDTICALFYRRIQKHEEAFIRNSFWGFHATAVKHQRVKSNYIKLPLYTIHKNPFLMQKILNVKGKMQK